MPTKQQLTDQLICAQYDLHDAKCKHNVLLLRKFKPLLTDVVDAIEINAYHIALERVKYVLELIDENTTPI